MDTRHASAAPVVLRDSDLDGEAVRNVRVDLAACFRMAARLGLHEGICNRCGALPASSVARPAA